MRRSIILDVTVGLVFDAALVLSIYLLFAGHNQPGGGFVGGLVAASALALRVVAGGDDALDDLPLPSPSTLLSVGLTLAAATAVVPLVFGAGPLDHEAFSADVALLGHVKVTSALSFDTGVYLVVVGLGTGVLRALAPSSGQGPEAP